MNKCIDFHTSVRLTNVKTLSMFDRDKRIIKRNLQFSYDIDNVILRNSFLITFLWFEKIGKIGIQSH